MQRKIELLNEILEQEVSYKLTNIFEKFFKIKLKIFNKGLSLENDLESILLLKDLSSKVINTK